VGSRESNICLPDHAIRTKRVEQRVGGGRCIRLRTERRRDELEGKTSVEHGLHDGIIARLDLLASLADDGGNQIVLRVVIPVSIDADTIAHSLQRLVDGADVEKIFVVENATGCD
jgi:hypothetical protein